MTHMWSFSFRGASLATSDARPDWKDPEASLGPFEDLWKAARGGKELPRACVSMSSKALRMLSVAPAQVWSHSTAHTKLS